MADPNTGIEKLISFCAKIEYADMQLLAASFVCYSKTGTSRDTDLVIDVLTWRQNNPESVTLLNNMIRKVEGQETYDMHQCDMLWLYTTV